MFIKIDIEQNRASTSRKRIGVLTLRKSSADGHHLIISFAGRDFGRQYGAGSGGGEGSGDYHPYGGDRDINLLASKVSALKVEAIEVAAQDVEARVKVIAPLFRTPKYSGGLLGGGGALSEDLVTGESTLVVHNVVAKNGISAPVFTARLVTATGGISIESAAFATLTDVVDCGAFWECYYKSDYQLWEWGDLARIQSAQIGPELEGLISITTGFLWAKVLGVSEESNSRGEFLFNLSKTDKSAGSNGVPAVGNVVVLYGNANPDTTKAYRRTITITSCGVDNIDEGFWPYSARYINIYDFSIGLDKEVEWRGRATRMKVSSMSVIGLDGDEHLVPYGRVTLFRWSGDVPPAKPVGNTPVGWSSSRDKVAVLTDSSGVCLTDSSGALLLASIDYPSHYRLWQSEGFITSGAMIWGEPIVQQGLSGNDGNDGANGTDGASGQDAIPYTFRGEFAADTPYYNNAQRRDIVRRDDLYYIYKGGTGQAGGWNAANWDSFIGNFESVATGLLFAKEAFVDNLGVRRLQTAGGLIDIEDRTIAIKDDSTNVRLLLTSDRVASDIENDSGSVPAVSYSCSSSGSQLFGGVMVVGRNGSRLSAFGTLTALNSHSTPQGYRHSVATLWLRREGVRTEKIATVGGYDIENENLGNISVSAAWSDICSAGRYQLELEYVFDSMIGGSPYANATMGPNTAMSWNYSPDTIKRTELGVNGIVSVWSALRYLMCYYELPKADGSNASTANKFRFKFRGDEWDTPGVLCKAKIAGQIVSKKWNGAAAISRVVKSNNIYTVYHYIGNANYSAIVTPLSGGGAYVIEESDNYVKVVANGNFNIMLIGNN